MQSEVNRELLCSGPLMVKRSSSSLWRPRLGSSESSKWSKCAVALYNEDGSSYLVVFLDNLLSLQFFDPQVPGNAGSARSSSLELISSMNRSRSSSPLEQLRGIHQIIRVQDIIGYWVSTQTAKVKFAADITYRLTLLYCPSLGTDKQKRKLKISSGTQEVIDDWIFHLDRCRANLATKSSNQPDVTENELYVACSTQAFTVKLIALPQNCPNELKLRLLGKYRVRLDANGVTLLENEAAEKVLAKFPLNLIRGFGKISPSCKVFWFEAGSRCPTGAGFLRFETADANQMYALIFKQVELFKKRKMQMNAAAPSYEIALRESEQTVLPTAPPYPYDEFELALMDSPPPPPFVSNSTTPNSTLRTASRPSHGLRRRSGSVGAGMQITKMPTAPTPSPPSVFDTSVCHRGRSVSNSHEDLQEIPASRHKQTAISPPQVPSTPRPPINFLPMSSAEQVPTPETYSFANAIDSPERRDSSASFDDLEAATYLNVTEVSDEANLNGKSDPQMAVGVNTEGLVKALAAKLSETNLLHGSPSNPTSQSTQSQIRRKITGAEEAPPLPLRPANLKLPQ